MEWSVLAAAAAAFLWPVRRADRAERATTAALAALIVLGTWPVLRNLRVADLNACYPFVTPDSYDWINNGLFWAGEPVAPSFRPPGYPLVIAGLHRAGLLSALPALGVGMLLLTAALLHRFLRRAHGTNVAAFATAIFVTNAYVQDSARHVMAETWATFFLVAAASAFASALDDPRRYRAAGLLLGAGFLFHYAALPAGIGCAAAVLLARRAHLRSRHLWQGLALAAALPIAWLVFRHVQYQRPGAAIHVIEGLVRLGVKNVRFYLVAGTALAGLALLPLYGAGALRLAARRERLFHPVNLTSVAMLAALSVHWLFLYDFVAKRFLVYLFPFAVALLAEGLEALADYARHGRVPAAIAAAYLLAALLWNQIQYPSSQIGYLAITPRDFLDAGLGIDGALVHRVQATWVDGIRGGVFDFRRRALPCDPAAPSAAVAGLKPAVDAATTRGEPVGLELAEPLPPEWAWARANRISNVLLRPVVPADRARVVLTDMPRHEDRVLAARASFALVRR